MEETERMYVDNIEVWVYEPPKTHRWNSKSIAHKLRLSEATVPIQQTTARNTTTLGMHGWLTERADPFGSLGDPISELAVGRASTPAPTESDTGLADEVDRAEVTSSTREGNTLRVKTFIDKDVGNVDVGAGESLSEVGLYAGDTFLNRAILANDIDKTNTKTATVDVLITFDSP